MLNEANKSHDVHLSLMQMIAFSSHIFIAFSINLMLIINSFFFFCIYLLILQLNAEKSPFQRTYAMQVCRFGPLSIYPSFTVFKNCYYPHKLNYASQESRCQFTIFLVIPVIVKLLPVSLCFCDTHSELPFIVFSQPLNN